MFMSPEDHQCTGRKSRRYVDTFEIRRGRYMIPLQAGLSDADISRVIQGIVAGVGFLGAGAIVKDSRGGEVQGLTTAASIWITAAIGIAAGLGREASAVLGAVLAFVILSALSRISHWVEKL